MIEKSKVVGEDIPQALSYEKSQTYSRSYEYYSSISNSAAGGSNYNRDYSNGNVDSNSQSYVRTSIKIQYSESSGSTEIWESHNGLYHSTVSRVETIYRSNSNSEVYNYNYGGTFQNTRTATTNLEGFSTTELITSSTVANSDAGNDSFATESTQVNFTIAEYSPAGNRSTISNGTFSSTYNDTKASTFEASYYPFLVSTYTSRDDLLSFEQSTLSSTISFPQYSTVVFSRFSNTFEESKIISNLDTFSSTFYKDSIFSTVRSYFGDYVDFENPSVYEVAGSKHLKAVRTIQTFVERFEDDLEGFYVYTYGGSFTPIEHNAPVLLFSNVFEKGNSPYSWIEELQYSVEEVSSNITLFGNSVASTSLTFELFSPRTINLEVSYESSTSDDSSYFTHGLSTASFSVAGRSSNIVISPNFEGVVGYMTEYSQSLANTTSVTILKTDPLNYTSSTFVSYFESYFSYSRPYISNLTYYKTDTLKSYSSNYSTSADYFDQTVSTGEYGVSSNENGGTFSSFSNFQSSFDISESSYRENVGVSTTNVADDINMFEAFAIFPDYKKGFVGFSSSFSLYERSSVSFKNDEYILPNFSTFCFKNKNQTKIGLECVEFTDYEDAYVSRNSYSLVTASYTQVLYGTSLNDDEDEVITYSYTNLSTFLNFSHLTTSILSSFSYSPNYLITSSAIDDKNLEIYYTISKRNETSSSFEVQENTAYVKLENLCSNTKNFTIHNQSFFGGFCPDPTDSWTLYYKGHLFITKVLPNGSSLTESLLNTNEYLNLQTFSNGECIAIEEGALYQPQQGRHYLSYS